MGDFLQNSFVDVVNMSITASYVIIFVLLARLCLKKAPRIFSYSLWTIVLFRLVCPFSFSSAFRSEATPVICKSISPRQNSSIA